jgi:uncharacterized protein (TIGR03083 family)
MSTRNLEKSARNTEVLSMDGPLAEAFTQASQFLVQAVRLVPASKWEAPGLGTWTVRELVGHANRGQTTVEEYLLRPQEPEPASSTYFTESAIAQRGRDAVQALGDDPAAVVGSVSDRVIALIEQTPADATIGSPAGTMTLRSYLPSRAAELTIHGLDVGRAIRADLEAPPEALRESLAFTTQLGVRKGSGTAVLLALSGRGQLPAGYSVY